MGQKTAQVVIIGGGISGLSAAWEVQQAGLSYVMLEAGDRWGGKIVTEHVQTDAGIFRVEGGAESFVARKPAIWQIAKDMAATDEVVSDESHATGIRILNDGIPMPLPMGPLKFLRTRMLTPRGKLRLLMEPFVPAKADSDDESLASFVERRLGPEAHERMIGPILGGIYNADTTRQSIMVTSPVMRMMEKKHGSLFKAVAAMKFKKKPTTTDTAGPPGRFITFADGSGGFINAIVSRLTGDLRLNAPVERVRLEADGYRVEVAGEAITADAVLIATPANVGVRLLAEAAPEAVALMDEIEHVNIGTASLMYPKAAFANVERFTGLMIPQREKRCIDAITWTSYKKPQTVPAGYEMLRIHFGGGNPETVTMPEDELLRVIGAELRALIPGFDANPVDYRVYRWADSYPQADVDHLDHVTAIEAALPPGVYVTGSSYRGLAVPDCVGQAVKTARALIGQFNEEEQG
jgi:protoporphyrinogen/coproporphyrinogen III oxidase